MVGDGGEQLGILPFRDALKIAQEKGQDIVEVAPGAKPPVCRLMDYGKYKYEQSKRERDARKKQKIITIKEIKLRPNIEDHDLDVKTRNAARFLQEGDKVKVTVMFRGREISHAALSRQLCTTLAKNVGDIAVVEREPKVEGRNMIDLLPVVYVVGDMGGKLD